MRRSRLIAVGIIVLFGIWLVWRQFVQRRRATRPDTYDPGSSSPMWTSVPASNSIMTKLATTAESTHNQSDALTQPQEPAAPPPPTSLDSSLGMDTTLRGEPTIEPDTASESDDEAEPIPQDDLIRIEGIGPKISTVVFAAGITTFAELSSTDVERLEAILDEAGIHTANPSTWPEQARLAAQGQWDDLKELQDRIKNGQLEV
jgi:predicted flap endonuclease-1-like 5' DNA nuclease